MSSLPIDKAEDKIDAEVMARAIGAYAGYLSDMTRVYSPCEPDRRKSIISHFARAIQAEKTEADHFKSHFTKLAKVNPAANTALDTARREWAAKTEGK